MRDRYLGCFEARIGRVLCTWALKTEAFGSERTSELSVMTLLATFNSSVMLKACRVRLEEAHVV